MLRGAKTTRLHMYKVGEKQASFSVLKLMILMSKVFAHSVYCIASLRCRPRVVLGCKKDCVKSCLPGVGDLNSITISNLPSHTISSL